MQVDEIVLAVNKIKLGYSPGIDRNPIAFLKQTIELINLTYKYCNYILK